MPPSTTTVTCYYVIRNMTSKLFSKTALSVFVFVWLIAVLNIANISVRHSIKWLGTSVRENLPIGDSSKSPRCPALTTGNVVSCRRPTLAQYVTDGNICRAALASNTGKGGRARGPPLGQVSWTPANDAAFTMCASNCSHFRSEMGYATFDDVTQEELDFPLAFSILVYERWEQTERLLRLIYRPQNVYCLFIDGTVPRSTRRAVLAVTRCLAPNVFVADSSVNATRGTIRVINAEMSICGRNLLATDGNWKYWINLEGGRDFPLRTNLELVRLLKSYDGGNDVDGDRMTPVNETWTANCWENGQIDASKESRPPRPPFATQLIHGRRQVAVRWEFVYHVIYESSQLLMWLACSFHADELVYSSLNHNLHQLVPGAYTGFANKTSLTRARHLKSNESSCGGRWTSDGVCSVGIADFPWIITSPELFLDGINLDTEPLAFRCLELWYHNRLRRERNVVDSQTCDVTSYTDDAIKDWNFDVEFYAQQPWSANHVNYYDRQIHLS